MEVDMFWWWKKGEQHATRHKDAENDLDSITITYEISSPYPPNITCQSINIYALSSENAEICLHMEDVNLCEVDFGDKSNKQLKKKPAMRDMH